MIHDDFQRFVDGAMMVDLLPETMRFVSIGEDGRFQLEFVFEVTCGLARFTLPICVGGKASIDEALVEATQQVRHMGLAMAKAAQTAEWVEAGERRATAAAAKAPGPQPRKRRRHDKRHPLLNISASQIESLPIA